MASRKASPVIRVRALGWSTLHGRGAGDGEQVEGSVIQSHS